MNLEQMRKRIAEIAALLGDFQKAESFTEDQISQIDALNKEFSDLSTQIEAAEKVEEMAAKAQASQRKTAPVAATPKIEVVGNRIEKDPKRGFSSAGEFYSAVLQSKNGNVDKKLIQAGLLEKFGEDGGYLVPEDYRLNIQKKVMGDESLLPLTTQFQTTSNTITLPTNEVAPWDSTAGIQAYWDGEAAAHTASKDQFGEISMKLHKLTALVKITEELMEDAPLLESWINAQAPDAILHKINSALIGGSGAGLPQGILNSGFKVQVAKESGQAADTILFENVNKMLGALLPSSLPRARWIVNPAILPLLRLMTFGSGGSNPVPAYLPATGVAGAPFGTLYGLPIMPMMGAVKAVGDVGDIILADMSYYFSAVKTGGIKSAISTHVYFEQSINALKFTQRVAGQIPYKTPITNQAGDFTGSGIIVLEAR